MSKEFLDRLESGLARLIEELEAARIRQRQLETEADGLRIHSADRDKLDGRVQELARQGAENGELRREVSMLREELQESQAVAAKLAALDSQHQQSAQKIAGLEMEITEARQSLTAARSRIDGLEGANKVLAATSESMKGDLAAANALLNESDSARNQDTAELEAARTVANTAAARVIELEGWNKSLLAEREQAREARDQAQADVAPMATRIAELEALTNSLLSERNEAFTTAEAAKFELANSQTYASEINASHAALLEERNILCIGLNDAREAVRQRDILTEKVSVMQGEMEEAFRMLEQADVFRRDNEDLKTRLEATIAREAQTRERLNGLVQRIEETEHILESAEVGAHGRA
ncbi:hypothetical protein BH09SUM1_BH09SUM1_17530 [soil metagenome]